MQFKTRNYHFLPGAFMLCVCCAAEIGVLNTEKNQQTWDIKNPLPLDGVQTGPATVEKNLAALAQITYAYTYDPAILPLDKHSRDSLID